MNHGPSRAIESLVAILLPPASREEVLGDLYERYRSPFQYGLDVVRTVPLVVISRIRRTADPQVLLLQSPALYLSFVSAAWFSDRETLRQPWGLLRLAIPSVMALLGLILEDAYASPGHRSAIKLARGPAVGSALALIAEGIFSAGLPDFTLPLWNVLGGGAMSLLLCSAVRLLFPPAKNQFRHANAPVLLTMPEDLESVANELARTFQRVADAMTSVNIDRWLNVHLTGPRARLITLLLLVVVVFEMYQLFLARGG